jgi:two-component system CheB/CheR fusion protein
MELAEALEGAVAVPGYSLLPVVGLGGSAGGITAIQEFLKAMPVDSGMAFVVILHLSPHHVSVLAEIFQRNTGMRVMTAEDGAELKVNCVYVIPEGKHLTSTDGHLRLTEATNPAGKRVAVDLFFRSLADSHGPHSVAVVLSGADGDGAIGIKRVKERGGLTIAQDPDEAEQVGMPRAAIATGMVDWVLKVAEIPGRLLTYRKRGGGAGAADGGGAGSGGEIDFDASGGGAGAAGDSGISAHEDVLRFFLL